MNSERERDPQNIVFLKPPEIRGVSKELIVSMANIVNAWGMVDQEHQLAEFRSGDFGVEGGLMISKTFGMRKPALIASVGYMRGQDLVIMETNLLKIAWNRELSAKEAKLNIAKIDDKFKSMGLVNAQTGERIPFSFENRILRFKSATVSVNEIFSDTRIVVPTVVNGQTEDEMLARYDDPSKLEIRYLNREIAIVRLRRDPDGFF